MNRLKNFLVLLIKSVIDNELIPLSNELTYKLLISFFPFLIFLMSLLGFANIHDDLLLVSLSNSLPPEIMKIIHVFFEEVIFNKSVRVLSSSLIVTIYTASSGFYSIIRGLNKAYDLDEHRNFFTVKLISVALVIVFAVMLVFLLLLFIFGDTIVKFLQHSKWFVYIPESLFSFTGYLILLFFFVALIVMIYKLAPCIRLSLISCLPGAIFAVVFWMIASRIFNLYINNFSRFSKVYGSIGGVFILIFWINLIALILLIGGQINATLAQLGKQDGESQG